MGGPATYVLNAADLRPINTNNEIMQYSDDTYLIVPAQGSDDCHAKLEHSQSWAKEDNFSLNCAKSKIVFRPRRIHRATTQLLRLIDCIIPVQLNNRNFLLLVHRTVTS